GTPSGMGVPSCHEQLEAKSSAVAPSTATARIQRTGDTKSPQPTSVEIHVPMRSGHGGSAGRAIRVRKFSIRGLRRGGVGGLGRGGLLRRLRRTAGLIGLSNLVGLVGPVGLVSLRGLAGRPVRAPLVVGDLPQGGVVEFGGDIRAAASA